MAAGHGPAGYMQKLQLRARKSSFFDDAGDFATALRLVSNRRGQRFAIRGFQCADNANSGDPAGGS